MKNPSIRIVGKHITENDDELEEGYVEIELPVKDLLDEIDNEDIEDYARWSLDMRHEDDFESNIDDFDVDDLVKQLEYEGYNFSIKIGEEDCIEFLEESGYTVLDKNDAESSLDYIDASMLGELTERFLNASVFEREEIYNKIMNL
jgi:hypothetical protein